MSVHALTLPRPSVEEGEFQEAMAHLASGVAVAACWDEDAPRGLLVRSLTTLSTQPPRVLFCVKKTDPAHGAHLRAKECSLTLLGADEHLQAEQFSNRQAPFEARDWLLEQDRPPQHRGGLVRLSGPIEQKIDAGSHSIFILRISETSIRRRQPLVYFDRAFTTCVRLPNDPSVPPNRSIS